VKKPIPQPQRKPQAPMRDEPLWWLYYSTF
jgi:hypothetical protein